MIQLFVREWFALIDYCNNKHTFDLDIFEIKCNNYFGAWKKLDHASQGEISDRISIRNING